MKGNVAAACCASATRNQPPSPRLRQLPRDGDERHQHRHNGGHFAWPRHNLKRLPDPGQREERPVERVRQIVHIRVCVQLEVKHDAGGDAEDAEELGCDADELHPGLVGAHHAEQHAVGRPVQQAQQAEDAENAEEAQHPGVGAKVS